MKKRIVLLSATLMLLVSSYSYAFDSLFNNTSSCNDDCGVATEMLQLISKLSDDIGLMADRIGEFGDRIVATEELMAELLVELVAQNGSSGVNDDVILLTPYGSTVMANEAPLIVTSNNVEQYLLFASPTVTMGTDALSVLIRNQSDLQIQWPELQKLAVDGNIFIAVKTIEGNSITSLSNSVLLKTL